MYQLENYIEKIDRYIKDNEFKGWEPYHLLNTDNLLSHNLPLKVYIYLTHINRLSPINMRHILHTPKIYNSKAMALFLSSYLNLNSTKYNNNIKFLLNWLINNKSNRYREYTIGFTHNIVLTGYSSKPEDPSLIITLFVMYAFISYFEKTHDRVIEDIILNFRELIQRELPKFENEHSLWYSYQFDQIAEVYNATAKIGKYFALMYNSFKEEKLLQCIDKILNYLLTKQRRDGSWAYNEKEFYTDGFHTAFVLEAIWHMIKLVNNKKYIDMFNRGLAHYKNYLLKQNYQPLYFHPKYQPKDIRRYLTETDIRDCAMAIVLFSIIGESDFAIKVLNWTLKNMYNNDKHFFYYCKSKFWTNKIEFIRWQAWMLYALSIIRKEIEK